MSSKPNKFFINVLLSMFGTVISEFNNKLQQKFTFMVLHPNKIGSFLLQGKIKLNSTLIYSIA